MIDALIIGPEIVSAFAIQGVRRKWTCARWWDEQPRGETPFDFFYGGSVKGKMWVLDWICVRVSDVAEVCTFMHFQFFFFSRIHSK